MRKKVMAVVIAVLAFSLIAASAATMPNPNQDAYVGVADQIIASCQSDGFYDVDYTVGWAGGEFRIQSATVTGLDAACDGADVSIRLLDGTSGVLGPIGTGGPVAGGAATVSGLNASAVLAEAAVIVVSG